MGDGGKSLARRSAGTASEDQSVAYPFDTSVALQALQTKYLKQKRAQSVSFRKLVPWLKVGERATHYIHPYPAKLLPQIAHFFLAARDLSPHDGLVLDPFGGTGTVALEAVLSGRKALYADVNPLACLIAKVKTSLLNIDQLAQISATVSERYFRLRRGDLPPVVNVRYWYAPETAQYLGVLRRAIVELPEDDAKDFFLITFSAIARKLSQADPRLSVPVRSKTPVTTTTTKRGVWDTFCAQLNANFRRMAVLAEMLPESGSSAICAGEDARSLRSAQGKQIRANSVDLVLTSPPYAGAQKYIRSSSLSLGWLRLAVPAQLSQLERKSIGREHFRKAEISDCPITNVSAANIVIARVWRKDKVRAQICGTYLNEMEAAIREIVRVLRPGGHLILVIGNNEVCGQVFKSSAYLQELSERMGLQTKLRLVDAIRSRGLMTKRNRSAGVISREWVILMQKPSTAEAAA